jgi:hypothetical protein
MYYVYALYKKNIKYKTNSIDEHLFYIGITSSNKNFYFRMKNHKREKSNPYKLNIIAKYDFIVKILWRIENKEEAEEREEFLIKWFGKRIDKTGILSNILSSSKDYSRLPRIMSKDTKNKISKALKKVNQNRDYLIANRDRNLTVNYNQVLELIEEWAKNPLETQQSFANRKGLNRSKFKDWLRLYKPEYIGLTKKKQKEIFDNIDKTNKKNIQIIKEYAKISGYTEQQAHGIYYRLIKENQV